MVPVLLNMVCVWLTPGAEGSASVSLTRQKNPAQAHAKGCRLLPHLKVSFVSWTKRKFQDSLCLWRYSLTTTVQLPIPWGASQTAMVKIVFLLLLIAICVALSYAGLWMEWRNRAVAVIQLVSRKAATSVQCGTITRPCGWLSYSPASWRQAALMAGRKREGNVSCCRFSRPQ